MKIIILAIRGTEKKGEYELELMIGDARCSGRVTRRELPFCWGLDSALEKALEPTPFAAKHLLTFVGAFADGEVLFFPIDAGDFQVSIARRRTNWTD
jgi:hypothetical protein